MAWLAALSRSFGILFLLSSVSTAHATAPVFEPPVPLLPGDHVAMATALGAAAPLVAVTNGTGTWVVVWTSSDLMGGMNGGDEDLLFARSTDGGLTFGVPSALNADAAHDTQYFYDLIQGAHDQQPSVAAHGNRFIAVWHNASAAAPYHTIKLARSEDAGATWTAPTVLFDYGMRPSIATDGAGTWVIVWEHKPGVLQDGDVYFTRSTDDGLTWSPAAVLNDNAAADSLTDVPGRLVYAAGVWVVPWTARYAVDLGPFESHVMFSRSVDGGASWSSAAPLNTGPSAGAAWDWEPSVAGDGTGGWIAAWSSDRGAGDDYDLVSARSSDAGVTWSAPSPLHADFADDARDDYPPVTVSSGPGTYVVEWSRFSMPSDPAANHTDVLVATTVDGGATWTGPTPLNAVVVADATPNVGEFAGDLAVDPAGHVLAFWISNAPTLASGTRSGRFELVYAFAGHPCGNGVIDAGETCDDADRGSLDCCDRTCAFDPAGAVCAADADLCTLERCDGSGTCTHPNAPLGTPCTPDDDLCTFDRCDGNDVCEHVYAPQPVTMAPIAPRSSTVSIAGGGNRKLTWTWATGPETQPNAFSIFATGANYALCLYDDTGLAARFDIPAGGSCGYIGGSCWKFTSKGIKSKLQYVKRDGASDGITSAIFATGAAGKTKVKIVGRGAGLPVPALPISGTLHAQLVNEEYGRTVSVAASYAAGVKVNAPDSFRAKSD